MSERDKLLSAITKSLADQPPRALKALLAIVAGKVTVLSANEYGIRYEVFGSRREPYQCAVGEDRNGKSITSCTCEGSQFHPVSPRCSHVLIGRWLHRR